MKDRIEPAGPPARLIRLLLDARSDVPGGQAALDDYIAAHPEDCGAAEELARLWEEIGRVPAPALRLPAEAASSASPSRFAGRGRLLPASIAAGICLAVLLPWLPSPFGTAVAQAERIVAGAEMRRIQLDDGSRVMLAAGSALQVAMTPERRGLKLENGEAFFDVAHDRARPFVVSTADGETVAVGTAFDVRVAAGETIVTVTEGKVRVAAPGADRPRYVSVGQQLRYGAAGGRGSDVVPVDSTEAVEWTTGMLRFEGVPLDEVIERVNRHTVRKIILADAKLAGLPVFATLKVGQVDGLLAIVAAQAGLSPAQAKRALRIESLG